MKIKAIFRTSENRGDHAADIYTIHDIEQDETVEALIKRCGMQWPSELIELKILKEST